MIRNLGISVRATTPLLTGKTVLIAGGGGTVNQSIAATLRSAGAVVVFPEEIRGDASVFTCAAEVDRLAATTFERFGSVDCLVAGFGGEAPQQLANTPLAECQTLFNCHLVSHVLLMRAFKESLASRGGAYVIVHDRSSPHFAGNGGLGSTLEGAELLLARNLASEAGGLSPHIYTLVLSSATASTADASWLTPGNLPEAVLRIAAHPDLAQSGAVIECNWRDQLEFSEGPRDAVSYL